MAARIAGATPAVLSLAKFMAPPYVPPMGVTYTHGAGGARNRCAGGAIRGPLAEPREPAGKRQNFRARTRADACVAGQNLAWSHRTVMLSQLRCRVPAAGNRPMG